MKDYYTILYNIILSLITWTATEYGRLKIELKTYSSKIALRYEKCSYIRAKFIAYKGDSVDIYSGQIQFFLQHKYHDNIHYLAYIKWYQLYNTCRFYLLLKNNN